MIEKHDRTTLNMDEVLREYSDASENFDADILDEYLNRYPEYADRLRNYASVWLMSSFATPEEIASEVVSKQEMLTLQSRLLSRLHSLNDSQDQDEDIEKVIERLNDIKGKIEFDRVAREVLGNIESQEEELLFAEYLEPGLNNRPTWVDERLGSAIQCPTNLIAEALNEYQARAIHRFSAKGKPMQREPRNWKDAVQALSISEQRKQELQKF